MRLSMITFFINYEKQKNKKKVKYPYKEQEC